MVLVSVLDAWGGGVPYLRSESGVNPLNVRKNGVGGGDGWWVGGRSLITKCFPKKKGPKEILWLVLTAAFWLPFSQLF